ncbi:hypothetical protein pb186bvf_010709 [Paramecium bursaria]
MNELIQTRRHVFPFLQFILPLNGQIYSPLYLSYYSYYMINQCLPLWFFVVYHYIDSKFYSAEVIELIIQLLQPQSSFYKSRKNIYSRKLFSIVFFRVSFDSSILGLGFNHFNLQKSEYLQLNNTGIFNVIQISKLLLAHLYQRIQYMHIIFLPFRHD